MIEILRTYEPTAVRETITRLRTLLADWDLSEPLTRH